MKIKLLFILVFLMGTFCFPQKYLERQLQGNISQDQIVSLSSNLTVQQTIELLSKVGEKVKGKKIVSTVQINDPLGIELTNIPYDKALVALVQMKGLIYEEKEDVIIIKRKNETVSPQRTEAKIGRASCRERV